MKKIKALTIILVAVLCLAAFLYYLRQNKSSFSPIPSAQNGDGFSDPADQTRNTDTNQGQTKANVKTFNITAKNFSFSTGEISVKQGDTVKIVLESEQGLHDFVINEFNVATKRLETGEIDSVQFIADKTGSFEYYCSVGTHRQMGMKGTLNVE